MTPSPAPSPPSRQLLVVDDEVDMLDFVERVFRREYRVRRAQSVDEALGVLEREEVDVLITDRRMPRRSGLELLERAAVLRPLAVRVLLSGYAEADSGNPPAAADACVAKPVDGDTLRTLVTEALERRRQA